jgi:hypothetical protein
MLQSRCYAKYGMGSAVEPAGRPRFKHAHIKLMSKIKEKRAAQT